MGSCLTLGNKLSEETRELKKQEALLGKGTETVSIGSGNPELLSHAAHSLEFHGDGIAFRVVFGPSF